MVIRYQVGRRLASLGFVHTCSKDDRPTPSKPLPSRLGAQVSRAFRSAAWFFAKILQLHKHETHCQDGLENGVNTGLGVLVQYRVDLAILKAMDFNLGRFDYTISPCDGRILFEP